MAISHTKRKTNAKTTTILNKLLFGCSFLPLRQLCFVLLNIRGLFAPLYTT